VTVAWILFAWVLVNQAGVPVPVVPSLLAAGVLAGRGSISLSAALAVIAGAALCADLGWYGFGRWRGAEALRVLGRLSPGSHRRVHRAQRFFLTHQVGFLLVARFLPAVNPIAAGLAGAARMGVWRYVLVVSGGALLWAVIWAGLGYVLHDGIALVAAGGRMTGWWP
jgi:membrane protein DedA with SNARE-associated domain